MKYDNSYPLVNQNILPWKDPPFFYGKIHYFDWAMFNCYVSSPEGSWLTDVDSFPQVPNIA